MGLALKISLKKASRQSVHGLPLYKHKTNISDISKLGATTTKRSEFRKYTKFLNFGFTPQNSSYVHMG